MTAQDRIEQLKAERRAELKKEADAAEVERQSRENRRHAAWLEGVAAALAELQCDWLAPHRSPQDDGAPFDAASRTFREAAFRIPGHAMIVLRIEDISYHGEDKWRLWTAAPSWLATWAVRSGLSRTDCGSLADALIAAEEAFAEEASRHNREPIPF